MSDADGRTGGVSSVALTALALCFLAPRAWIYAGLPPENWGSDPYPQALATRFWDYLWSSTLVPPLEHAILKLPIAVLGLGQAEKYHGFLLTTFTLDAIAIFCVWRAILILGGAQGVAFASATLYSVMLIPFELWRASDPWDHRDHHTVVMVAALAYASALMRRRADGRAVLTLGAASALYILQASTAVVAVTVALVVLGSSLSRSAWMSLAARPAPLVMAALLMFGAVGFLVARSRASTGTFQLSTRQGPALVMFVQEAYDYDEARVRQLAEKTGVPPWYLWCFDHAQVPVPAGHPTEQNWQHLTKAFGMCMRSTIREPIVSGRPWPFDFTDLIQHLAPASEPATLRVAQEDDRDTRERQYLFFGSSPELSPKWIAFYGAQSQRIWLHLISTDPVRFLKTVWREHLRFARGAEYFAVVGDELHTQEYPLRRFLTAFDRWFAQGVLLLAYACVPVAVVVALRDLARRTSVGRAWDYLALALPVCALAATFSAAVATENERYFAQITPLLVALGALVASRGFGREPVTAQS